MNQEVTEELIERSDPSLILSSRVVGTPVFDRAGTRLGHVDDLSIERVSGKTIYAIMSFGGFLGIGEKFHPLPWSLLDYDVAQAGFVVPLDRAALQGAPAYDRDELRALGGSGRADYDSTIFSYYNAYGNPPVW